MAGAIAPSHGSGLTRKIKTGWLQPGAHSFMQMWNLHTHTPPRDFLKVLGRGEVERTPSCWRKAHHLSEFSAHNYSMRLPGWFCGTKSVHHVEVEKTSDYRGAAKPM